MSLCNSKTSKGSHAFVYLSACSSACIDGPPCASDTQINSVSPKCSSSFCIVFLDHILCLIVLVTTFTKDFSGSKKSFLISLIERERGPYSILSCIFSCLWGTCYPRITEGLAESEGYVQTSEWQTHEAIIVMNVQWRKCVQGPRGIRTPDHL